jgi:pilus assembly protein CpaB
MSRRRRAALLLGLALVLGGLAASDVARREAALRDQLGPLVDVLVARRALEAGHRLVRADLAVRRVPARFAPAGGPVLTELLVGHRLAVPVADGGHVNLLLLERPEPTGTQLIRRGERAAEVVAIAAPQSVTAGARVDVLVTREAGDRGGGTDLALEDVEVLAARPAADGDAPRGSAGRRLAVTLRVTVRQAVYLAAAGAFAREIRLLARAPDDHRRVARLGVGRDLR